MKRMLRLFSLGLLLSAGMMINAADCCTTDNCCTDDCCETICGGGHPYFSVRSQSINAARELVGWQAFINKFEMESVYGAFSITAEYTRSFKPCRLAGFFFGDDLQNGALTISGSRKGVTAEDSATGAVARGEHEWLADYFGLSPNFESTVKFTPRISNFLVDLNLYLGFDEWWEGGFFRIHAPIVYTRWEMKMCEDVVKAGTLRFDAGYMDSVAIAHTSLPADFKTAMKGVTWGDMTEALKYGKISDCKQTKTRLSDIEVALGWNFLQDEDYHLGLMLRASFPTGNKPCGTYLFEPIVGAGGHWMLGGGLTSHVQLWTSDDEESNFCMYLDANVGHYFKTKQTRSFDLKDRKNSRYILIQELGTPVANLYAGDAHNTAVAPSAQYKEKLFPLINKTTCCTDVSIAVQGDLAIKFAYNNGGFSFDIGYNLWGRSGEKFNEDCCKDCCLESKKYALKGDAYVIGWGANNATTVGIRNLAIPLSATEKNATINAGTNTVTGTAYALTDRYNPRIDNVKLAFGTTTNADDSIQYRTGVNHAGGTQQHTSYQPVFLSCDDLNMCKTPSALSHKIFAHFSYAWDDKEDDEWIPFLGVGGEVEFSGKSCETYSAVSQWGVWLKGGLAFD